MRQLVVHQVLRDDADDLAAGGERGVGDDAHQPDVPAAVDDADARASARSVAKAAAASRWAGGPYWDPVKTATRTTRSAAVLAGDPLGDADRLVAALALDGHGEDGLEPAGDLLGRP